MKQRSSCTMAMGITFWSLAAAVGCGTQVPQGQRFPQGVDAVPDPTRLLSFVLVEIQDGLAPPALGGPCVQPGSADTGTAWHFEACPRDGSTVTTTGDLQLWGQAATVEPAQARARFSYARRRPDGSIWQSTGQTEIATRTAVSNNTRQRALMHGTMALPGDGQRSTDGHVYAFHLRLDAGVDGADAYRMSGVAQLNFAAHEATTQIKLVSMIFAPGCPWPRSGSVSIATTAGDGSVLDATRVFTDLCGVVRDERGDLTPLAVPWDEGA